MRIKPSNHNNQLLPDKDKATPLGVGVKVGLAVAVVAGVFKVAGATTVCVGDTMVWVGGTGVAEGGMDAGVTAGGMGVSVADGLTEIVDVRVTAADGGVDVDVLGNRVGAIVERGNGVPGTSVGAVVAAGNGVGFSRSSVGGGGDDLGVLVGTV